MSKSKLPVWGGLKFQQIVALGVMVSWAIIVASCYAAHLFDWIGALLYELPIVLGLRFIWDTVKISKEGTEFSREAAETLNNAIDEIATQAEEQRERPLQPFQATVPL